MTPPLSVLKRAYTAETKTDTCYVVVVAGKSRKTAINPINLAYEKHRIKKREQRRKKKLAKLAKQPPKYKLLWNGEDEASKISEEQKDETETTILLSEDGSDSNSDNGWTPQSTPPRKNSSDSTPSSSTSTSVFSEGYGANLSIKDIINKIMESERREKKLQRQLEQSGVAVAEDIPYEIAKQKIEEIAKRMGEIGGTDVVCRNKQEQTTLREEYFKLEQEMERYNAALMVTDEWQAEQDELERKWEEDNEDGNKAALVKLRRHMPVMIRQMTKDQLVSQPTPNGKFLPIAIVKKFKRTNVLQLLRMNPDDIERMHPSSLESLRVTGLALTERRSLYVHLKPIADKWKTLKQDEMTGRKWKWFLMMKGNFKDSLDWYQRHEMQYGDADNHPPKSKECPHGCPLLGRQCPIVADLLVDYSEDYGFTEKDEYEVSQIRKSNDGGAVNEMDTAAKQEQREKRCQERTLALKKHYKGKLLQVSQANGSCETMDEIMDKMEHSLHKWIDNSMDPDHDELLYSPTKRRLSIREASQMMALQTERIFMGEIDETVEPPTIDPTPTCGFCASSSYEVEALDANKLIADITERLNELKLATLDFAQRAGISTKGASKKNKSDPRSVTEVELSEEVYDLSMEFFLYIEDRMSVVPGEAARVAVTVRSVRKMWGELHDRNLALLEKMGVVATRSRQQVTRAVIEASVIANRSSLEDDVDSDDEY